MKGVELSALYVFAGNRTLDLIDYLGLAGTPGRPLPPLTAASTYQAPDLRPMAIDAANQAEPGFVLTTFSITLQYDWDMSEGFISHAACQSQGRYAQGSMRAKRHEDRHIVDDKELYFRYFSWVQSMLKQCMSREEYDSCLTPIARLVSDYAHELRNFIIQKRHTSNDPDMRYDDFTRSPPDYSTHYARAKEKQGLSEARLLLIAKDIQTLKDGCAREFGGWVGAGERNLLNPLGE
jgi:hypothetical protein